MGWVKGSDRNSGPRIAFAKNLRGQGSCLSTGQAEGGPHAPEEAAPSPTVGFRVIIVPIPSDDDVYYYFPYHQIGFRGNTIGGKREREEEGGWHGTRVHLPGRRELGMRLRTYQRLKRAVMCAGPALQPASTGDWGAAPHGCRRHAHAHLACRAPPAAACQGALTHLHRLTCL